MLALLQVGLHRCERLPAALRQFAANRASEVKAIVREVVERLMPGLLGGGLLDRGASARDEARGGEGRGGEWGGRL